MITRMWVFPGGEEITLERLDADIARLKATVPVQILEHKRQPVPVQGMVDQMYDYDLEVGPTRTLLRITGRRGVRTRSGAIARPGTQTYVFPDMAVFAPIMSGKYDGKTYLFALIEVSDT